jgi:hypothetical protein
MIIIFQLLSIYPESNELGTHFFIFFLWPGSFAAFAALREDGELITWGNPGGGGDIHMNDLED